MRRTRPPTQFEEKLIQKCLELLQSDAALIGPKKVADKIRVEPSTITRWLSREREMSLPSIVAVLDCYKIPILFGNCIEKDFWNVSEEIIEYLKMAQAVLEANSPDYSTALAQNIRAFYKAIQSENPDKPKEDPRLADPMVI